MWIKTSNARAIRIVNTDAIQEIQDNGASGTIICFTNGDKVTCDLTIENWDKIFKENS